MLFEASCHQQYSPTRVNMASSSSMLQHQDQKNHVLQQQQAQTSSRILYDIPCKVCTDHSSGKHYGIFACDGCAGFFKRSIRRNRQYVCKSKSEGGCLVDKTHRNQCRACRLRRCVDVGMNKEAVQHERGPRNSTLRRQMSLYFKEHHHHQQQKDDSSPPPPPPQPQPITISQPHSPPMVSVPQQYSPPPFFHRHQLPFFPYLAAFPHLSPPFLPPPPHVLPPPPPPPPSPPASADTLSEIAAKLVFLIVRLVQQMPAFTTLPYRDQMTLLEETWRELFVLSAAQYALPLSEVSSTDSDSSAVVAELKAFQETLLKFQSMAVDATEFAFLRTVVLLKTTLERGELRDQVAVTALQDQAQLSLSQYIVKAYPEQPQRFGKLLLLLPSLRSISGDTIQSAFFKCVRNIPLEKLICDLFKGK